jgi:hypothetical protein
MNVNKDGGPAFPNEYSLIEIGDGSYLESRPTTGMTLRDYFAAKAMQGLYASGNLVFDQNGKEVAKEIFIKHISSISYEMADAMLKAREEQ